ncbi:MAG: YqgE/AlgH family protein [Fimbriimonadaceae bacterium]|nr:YqgE/AlgH family protein [Chitinophagales bacterium]
MIENKYAPAAGLFLLSEPFMPDPNFKRTVVLLCEHIEDGGTVGFILNKTLEIKVSDALVDFDEIQNDLFYGGPVAEDTLHYLHCYGDLIEDSLHIVDDVYWGGNFEQLTNLLKAGTLDANKIKFFLGYSGWSEGQLDAELKENSWIVAPAKGSYVFGIQENALWKNVLHDLGGEYSQLINYPENPILN